MSRAWIAALLVFIVFFAASAESPPPSTAATGQDFASSSAAISQAYLAVSAAQKDGGNVTGLVASLNTAVGLYSEAQAENGTSPAAAAQHLAEASATAQQVAQAAPGIGRAGLAARQFQEEVSLGAAVAIVALGAVLYVFGERIYHRLWLRAYSRHLVRKIG